jgi:hypothetical protein
MEGFQEEVKCEVSEKMSGAGYPEDGGAVTRKRTMQ